MLIVDAMAILQVIKKVSGMTTIAHLKKDFLNKILRLLRGYDEVRIVFDQYLKHSLKSKTRDPCTTSKEAKRPFIVIQYQETDTLIPLHILYNCSY